MNTDSASSVSIAGFWAWFTAHKAQMDRLDDTEEPFWDEALGELQKVNPGLWFALSQADGGVRDFVITAESDTELFPLVDAMVKGAPAVPKWAFIALKPAMGFDFVSEYEDLTLDPRAMWFFPMRNSARPRALGLRIAVPEFTKRREEQLLNAVSIILEEGLGERASASHIEHLEVVAVPANLKAEGYAPLRELPAYIAWTKANRTANQGWGGVAEWMESEKRKAKSEG